jgi:hypothetical protein
VVASLIPSRRERCWTAVVKNEDDWTSSQRSKLRQALTQAQSSDLVGARRLIPVARNLPNVSAIRDVERKVIRHT